MRLQFSLNFILFLSFVLIDLMLTPSAGPRRDAE